MNLLDRTIKADDAGAGEGFFQRVDRPRIDNTGL